MQTESAWRPQLISGLLAVWMILTAGIAAADTGFAGWVRDFRATAIKAGISGKVYDAIFSSFPGPDLRSLEKMRSQAEFDLKIWDYLDSAVSDRQVRNGQQAVRQFARQLAAIEKKYGVDRNVVLAVWGIETRYGERMGDYNVIQTLATLAWAAPRRRDFWSRELIHALRIVEAGHISVQKMNGSWAGAMGHTQFMPTSWKQYSADFDGDGRRDIWTNIGDALASTANYLAVHGWQRGKAWGYEVILPRGFDRSLAGKDGITLQKWQSLGVRRANGAHFPRPGDKAVLKLPAGANGPAFLVLRNFYVIKRYNNADAYALAVGHLADRIAGGGPLRQDWPRGYVPLDEAGRMELQAILKSLGYYDGEIDGAIGSGSREAIRNWQAANGVKPDGQASKELLNRLKGTS